MDIALYWVRIGAITIFLLDSVMPPLRETLKVESSLQRRRWDSIQRPVVA